MNATPCACSRSTAAGFSTTVCCAALIRSSAWSCCGQAYYHYIAPSLLWAVFLGLTIYAQLRHDLFRDFGRSAHELHDIQTQALGVVVARRKRVIFGKPVHDPRRGLMLGAMWVELGGFSYCPLQLLQYQLWAGSQIGHLNGDLQVALFTVLICLLLLSSLPSQGEHHRWDRPLKVSRSFLFDFGFMTFVFTTLNVAGCTNGVDDVRLGSSLTCASPLTYWIVLPLGIAVFGWLYYSTLLYKKQLASDVYAVSFRFQPSFDAIMAVTRTLGGLSLFTVEKCLLVLDAWCVSVVLSLLYLVYFGALLRHNYKCQPCLGVGYFPNNLRAVSFATSCYTAIVLLLVSLIQLYRHHEGADTPEWTLVLLALGAYPGVVIFIWRWNGRRARMFQVPNVPLLDGLAHETDRVRAIAAVSVTLEIGTRDPATLKAIILALDATLRRHDMVVAPAYACQALWFLWQSHFDLVDSISESTSDPIVPSGAWARLLGQVASRGSILNASGRLQVAHTQSRRRLSTIRLGSVSSSVLIELVEKSLDVTPAFPGASPNRITADLDVFACFEHVLAKLADLTWSASRDARFLASKVLHEMYQANVVRLGARTFFRMAVALTTVPLHAKAYAAAKTLAKLSRSHSDGWIAWLVADDAHTLGTLVDALRLHVDDVDFLQELLPFLLRVLRTLLTLGMKGPNPTTYISKSVAATLLELHFAPLPTEIAILVDDVLFALLQVWDSRKPSANTGRRSSKARILPGMSGGRRLSRARILPGSSIGRSSEVVHAPLLSAAQLQSLYDRNGMRTSVNGGRTLHHKPSSAWIAGKSDDTSSKN
ncbi:hypothetical protein SDRG_02732 [Saprolegnia diclina VS20]|uniref:Uncharacterized protein n=1 Tax=Saprolegnia diclina (strain VS20) TaxID=1156394 RepID=T0SBF1_SAPDV|nr:hypothetical protein SDRG_02732 [Saprolegnia diclina VS20]EQC40077.1 hypothetical protein SDRG_02732 [Saprolegnia diclina VS20]|eukprot:XP_008606551.1 hypothetical protein SDRG_02732 [Saprolegnia diclina VS20]